MDFGIDFDDASKCWRENKKPKANGCFVYKCQAICLNGKPCKRETMNVVGAEYCNMHQKKI